MLRSIDTAKHGRFELRDRRLAGSGDEVAILAGDVHARHKRAQVLVAWRVGHLQHHLDVVDLALDHLLFTSQSNGSSGISASSRSLTLTRLKLKTHRNVSQLDGHVGVVEGAVEENRH